MFRCPCLCASLSSWMDYYLPHLQIGEGGAYTGFRVGEHVDLPRGSESRCEDGEKGVRGLGAVSPESRDMLVHLAGDTLSHG